MGGDGQLGLQKGCNGLEGTVSVAKLLLSMIENLLYAVSPRDWSHPQSWNSRAKTSFSQSRATLRTVLVLLSHTGV